MMATEINLNNSEEFQEMIERKDFTIAKAVVESILTNLNGRKKPVHVLSVNCLEEASTFDITLDRKNMLNTLQVNLKIYEKYEDYEGCDNIIKAINTISAKR